MDLTNYIPYEGFSNFESKDGVEISHQFFETMKTRRTIREFTN